MSTASKNLQRLFSQYKILTLLFAIAVIWLLIDGFTGGGFFTDGSFYTRGGFLTPRNISNLFRQMASTAMLASGMVFIIISGEIDLSVGSLLGLLGGIAAILDYKYHLPLPAIFAVVIALGILVGCWTGAWVAYLRVPSFIVSLSGFLAFRGILYGITKGTTVPVESQGLVAFGQDYLPVTLGNSLAAAAVAFLIFQTFRSRASRAHYGLSVTPMWQDITKLAVMASIIAGFMYTMNAYEQAPGLPIPVLVVVVILATFTFMANRTVFGRRIYSIGSNLEATRLSGINVKAIKVAVFALMGLMCALAGLTTTARLAAGGPSAGNLGELDAIASCFIGGASSRGGVGTVHGALIGALIMASLDNGMSMLSVESYWQLIVKGSILLLAVWVDVISGAGSDR